MDESVKLVVQRRRKFNEDKCLFIREETQNLLVPSHVREIQYPEWLVNVVLVKKANRKWRMCFDFTNLNKACLKDLYPLPSIDSLVENALSCRLLSFLDAFSRYNQIRMHPKDESKRAFMVEFANYCYKVMPFSLKNVGTTYQWLMIRSSPQCSGETYRRMKTTWSSCKKRRTNILPTWKSYSQQ